MNIVILGAGASGLTAAISAAVCNPESQVTLLEHGEQAGKKILSTGNGRCNLTNENMSEKFYRCPDMQAVKTVLSAFNYEDTLHFFRDLGLIFKNRDGYIYPYSGQAYAVREVLQMKCKELGIICLTECQAYDIVPKKKGFLICFRDKNKNHKNQDRKLQADRLIVATGSSASNLPSADDSGLLLMRKLGYKIHPFLPALTGLRCKEAFCKALAGVRCDGNIKLYVNGNYVAEDTGEIQLTDYGLSGIPVFQVSRYAALGLYQKKKVTAVVDFFPETELSGLQQIFQEKRKSCPQKTLEEQCIGVWNQKLAAVFAGKSGGDMDFLLHTMKHCEFHVQAVNPPSQAQVCTGGIDVSQINFTTMESKIHRNLFFAGEIIDVDGMCGGYNLQWAWATGFLAGRSAAC